MKQLEQEKGYFTAGIGGRGEGERVVPQANTSSSRQAEIHRPFLHTLSKYHDLSWDLLGNTGIFLALY